MPRKAILAVLASAFAGYLAYPYATLVALQVSLASGSTVAVSRLVAWDAVREGIKEDISDDVAAAAPTQVADAANALPAFGTGFVRGIATSMVDQAVTPDTVAGLLRGTGTDGRLRLSWAFFDAPGRFAIELRRPDGAAAELPLRLQLDLRGGVWRITRAWLPRWMLEQAAAMRT